MSVDRELDGPALLAQLRGWAEAEGFSQIGVAGVDLGSAEAGLTDWLNNGFHGSMDYMAVHGLKRARLAEVVGPFGHRVFTDSAPVMEVELAAKSGIGWRGKHTLALHREGGSMF